MTQIEATTREHGNPGHELVARVVEHIASGTRYAVHPGCLTALGRLVEPREVAEAIAFLSYAVAWTIGTSTYALIANARDRRDINRDIE